MKRRYRGAEQGRRSPDVVAFISGALMLVIAVVALWMAFGGSVDTRFARIAFPVLLVAVGIFGLSMSRRPHVHANAQPPNGRRRS